MNNKNGSYATMNITQTCDAGSSGVQTVFDGEKVPGGYPYVIGDGNIRVKLMQDATFRTIPVVAIHDYQNLEIREIDWDNSDNVINHFGR